MMIYCKNAGTISSILNFKNALGILAARWKSSHI